VIVRGIEIANFRNIAEAQLLFSPTFNLITGRNAQGKTNLLEALYLFALGRSFRTRSLDEAIRFGEQYLFLRLSARSDNGVAFAVEVGLERAGRVKVSINGKKQSGVSAIVGAIPGVIFTAEDTMLASGPPAGRRAFLDYTAAQVSPLALQVIMEYRGILKRRNALLERSARGGSPPDGIEAWDEALIAKGAEIVRLRRGMMREVSLRAERLFGEILGVSSGFRMEYACSFGSAESDPAEALRDSLARARDAERRRGFTMAGPHYDDVRIFLESAELRRFGSQGRKRLAALVLKLAQALTILEERGERPVVILDDIFSELDRETADRVRAHLGDGFQSFITTPRPEEVGALPAGSARFFIEGGAIREAPGSSC